MSKSSINQFTISGNLTAKPEIRYAPSGKAVVNIGIAHTPRKLNSATGKWEDGQVMYFSAEAWESLAENLAKSLDVGSRVVVTGPLYREVYTNKDNVEKEKWKIKADNILIDLKYASATITKNPKNESSGDYSQNADPVENAAGGEDSPF